jgi:2'-5' RNA ligase
MGSTQANGVSVWLVPRDEVGRQLGGWIDRLAERFRTERFAPHLTLLSGIALQTEEALALAARAAAALSPFTVMLGGVEGRDEHFRCLFVRATLDATLRAAHEAVARGFAREPQADFLPHVSLVYGRLLAEHKLALAHEAGAEVSLRFTADALHVWSTQGPVAAWRELGIVPFGSR